MGRKSGFFAHALSSLDSLFAEVSGNRRKSPAFCANIPVLQRLSAEIGLITTAGRRLQSVSHVEGLEGVFCADRNTTGAPKGRRNGKWKHGLCSRDMIVEPFGASRGTQRRHLTRSLVDLPETIGIIDDVLTTGSHFRAMKDMVLERAPNCRVVGFFIARRAIPNPFGAVSIEDLLK